jgi:hypothetical protein
MSWFLCSAPIGARLNFGFGTVAGMLAFAAACAPLWLVARHAIRCRHARSERPQLRLVESRGAPVPRAIWSVSRFRHAVRL